MIKLSKLRKLEREHEIFLAMMYPHFGLNQKPTPIEIEIESPASGTGSFSYKELRIMVKEEEEEEMAFTTTHEGGHYLHSLNKNQLNETYLVGSLSAVPRWREFVAELSAVLFFLGTSRVHKNSFEDEIYELVDKEYTYKNIAQGKSKLKQASQIPERVIRGIGTNQLLEMMLPDYQLSEVFK